MKLLMLRSWRSRTSRNKLYFGLLVLSVQVGLAYSLLGPRLSCTWTVRGNLIQNEYQLVPERANYAAWKKCRQA